MAVLLEGCKPSMKFFHRFLPRPETLQHNRWLRWLGPRILHPRLWHFSRRGVAMGVALGVFFGLIIPLAQIPLAAGAAVALRANLPAAVASTLVTNPVTSPPLYYAAWKLGHAVLGRSAPGSAPPGAGPTIGAPVTPVTPVAADAGRWQTFVGQLRAIGQPLLVGLPLLACSVGLTMYFVVSWGWAARVRWLRQRRQQRPR